MSKILLYFFSCTFLILSTYSATETDDCNFGMKEVLIKKYVTLDELFKDELAHNPLVEQEISLVIEDLATKITSFQNKHIQNGDSVERIEKSLSLSLVLEMVDGAFQGKGKIFNQYGEKVCDLHDLLELNFNRLSEKDIKLLKKVSTHFHSYHINKAKIGGGFGEELVFTSGEDGQTLSSWVTRRSSQHTGGGN
jgi:hypothetical protein